MTVRQPISVAMCTYNGEAHLAEQMESILDQSRPASEVVVCDDRSTDGTWKMLEGYRERFPDLIKLHRNGANLGPTKNFEKAVGLCRGPLIALSDQDDVWRRDKLERLARRLEEDPGLALVFSNAALIDTDGNGLSGDLWRTLGFDRRAKADVKAGRAFEALSREPFVAGCTTMFRETLRSACLPIEEPYLHDHWISLVASVGSRMDFVDRELVSYRQHANNVVGARSVSIQRRFDSARRKGVLEYEQEIIAAEKLKSRLAGVEGARLSAVQQKIDFLSLRVELWSDKVPWTRKASLFVRALIHGRYRRWGNWRTLAKDLAVLSGAIALVTERSE